MRHRLATLLLLLITLAAAPASLFAQENAAADEDAEIERLARQLMDAMRRMDDSTGTAEPALRDELAAMLAEAETYVEHAPELPSPIAHTARTDSLAAAHGRRLVEVVDAHGWPTKALVGLIGASAAHQLFRHHVDAAALERLLPDFLAALAARDANPAARAILEDEALLKMGRPQRFGTQSCVAEDDGFAILPPHDDRDEIAARRADRGIKPLEDALRGLAAWCPCPSVPPCP